MNPLQIEARHLDSGHAVVLSGRRCGVALVKPYRLFVVVTFTDGETARFLPDQPVCVAARQDVAS